MSALAQLHAMAGDTVTGSDRLIDKGYNALPVWEKLKALGVKFTPQDGSGVTKDVDALVLSTAIEGDNPEIAAAKKYGIKIIHRAELLSSHVSKFKTVAISGTSGKSTTTAMVYEILEFAGLSPSVITGGAIISLQNKGYLGNVFRGKSDLLVIEADESDGSLVNYHPHLGVMLNLTRDHKEMDILYGYFRKFRPNCSKFLVNADENNLGEFITSSTGTFGLKYGGTRATGVELDGKGSSFEVTGVKFRVNHPGLYNVQNAIAAIAACVELGVPLQKCAQALAQYSGVARRFASVGTARGVEVIDDFAHNPAKIAAALSAAQLRGKRVLLFYQPHGYAPVKMLKKELITAFSAGLRKCDTVWFPEIYYVGGTADRTVSSKDICEPLVALGVNARYNPCREEIIGDIAASAQPGDVVVVMGARDPTLTDYAKAVLQAIGKGVSAVSCKDCLLNTKVKA